MKKLFLVIWSSFFFAMPVFAVTVSSLYQADIPVVSQADDLREQAVKDGFLQVLIKVSGNPEIEKNPVIKYSLQKAAYYVQEYTYSLPTTTSSEYVLQVRYEPNDVIRLLKKAKITYWKESRPLILVWLAATTKDRETEIINNDATDDIFKIMKGQGKKYGLPLIFPLMDMKDMDLVSVDDVSHMTIPILKEATKRYAPDAILIGKLQENEATTESEWELVLHDKTWNFTIADQSTQNVIANLINQVRKTLESGHPKKVARAEGPTSWVNLEIANIVQRDDLQILVRYLEQLSLVRQVKLVQVANNNVELSVLVQGTRDVFEQTVLSNQHLSIQDTNENKIMYQWIH
ncbi:MAG: DUF2066 domain-containing protein [Gammaproteobacteria bacterium]|nr:DUF2066 domain-containing protein [Gammaproteobacteria bacterium]